MNQNIYKPEYQASWALVVGINDYHSASPLSYACSDADSITNILIKNLGFPSHQVFTLKDSVATKDKILDEFIGLHKKANKPDDRVIFFFAGHGLTFPGNNGPIGYLVPVEGNPENLSTLLRWDDLTRNAELIPAKHILFIMDACYSGLALQRVATPGIQRFVSDMLQRFSRQVITAGKSDQTVADGGGPSGKNSIFTGSLLEGIRGAALDDQGILTASSLMHYVYQNVGKHPTSQQTPHYGHLEGDGDFILATPDQEHLKPGPTSDYLVEIKEEVPESPLPTFTTPSKPPFAFIRGYGNYEHPSFGRNDLTSQLGEFRVADDSRMVERAFSWLGILIEPIARQSVFIDIATKANPKNKINNPGIELYERFSFPRILRTTTNSLLLWSNDYYEDHWERFLKIESSGKIEYADTINTFREYKGTRMFKLTQIIGLTCQLLFLAKSLLAESGYKSGIRLTFGLVGTKDTVLCNFSQESGKNNHNWRDPGLSDIGGNPKCLDSNLKMEYDLVIGKLAYEDSLKTLKSIAQKIELAYNHHGSPRCFNVDTDIFPWAQYDSEQR